MKKYKETNFIIIITGARHSSTTLCKKFASLDDVDSKYEAFQHKLGVFWKEGPYDFDITAHINSRLKKIGWSEKPYLVFKIFPDHNISFEKIAEIKFKKSFVILRRNLKDSYASYIKSITTGNWGTTPEQQLERELDTAHRGFTREKMPFAEYKKTHENWFDQAKVFLKNSGYEYNEIWFEDVIDESFDCKNLIPGRW